MFDVAALMEDSETKAAAMEKMADLQDELGHVRLIISFFNNYYEGVMSVYIIQYSIFNYM